MNKITQKQRNAIEEALMCYTCDVFQEMTMQKLGAVRTVYAIISQALYDLYNGTLEQQKDAMDWFKSDNYRLACEAVQVDVKVMDRIIQNPDKYVSDIEYKDVEIEEYQDENN